MNRVCVRTSQYHWEGDASARTTPRGGSSDGNQTQNFSGDETLCPAYHVIETWNRFVPNLMSMDYEVIWLLHVHLVPRPHIGKYFLWIQSKVRLIIFIEERKLSQMRMFTQLFPSASDTDSERILWPLLTKDRESTRSFPPCLATKSNRWPFTTSKYSFNKYTVTRSICLKNLVRFLSNSLQVKHIWLKTDGMVSS